MGIKRGAVVRKCPSWALSPLVLISVSLSYLSIGILPYCLGTRCASPIYLLYSAHGAQRKARIIIYNVLISVSLSYLSIGILPYCLGTRCVSPMYLLYSAHGAQWKASNEL